MRTALFTGAGASRAIGYPLTSELLPRIRSELKSGALFDGINDEETDREDREQLRGFLYDLMPGLDRVPDHQLPLITDVFSLVEHAIISGESLPIGGDSTLRRCRDLLKQAITDVILGDFLQPWDLSKPEEKQQKRVHDRFVGWIKQQGDQFGLVTTNYDIGLEFKLYEQIDHGAIDREVDLGFDWRDVVTGRVRPRPVAPSLRVFKLHGSLDVLRCRMCGHVYFNPAGAIVWQAFRPELDGENTCACRNDARLELHIVSPSLVREVRDANLLSIWRSALEWMRTADRWIIVGYSLPPEDLAVRSLLLRAYAAAPERPQVSVVQLGEADRRRYDLLFTEYEYVPDGLEGFLARA